MYIRDRAKDIIIRGGENIAATAVENALFRLPQVQDCAVVGVSDRKLGELPAAVVVLRPSAKGVTEQSIIEGAKSHLPRHAVPVMVMLRTSDDPANELRIERNPNGKIVKSASICLYTSRRNNEFADQVIQYFRSTEKGSRAGMAEKNESEIVKRPPFRRSIRMHIALPRWFFTSERSPQNIVDYLWSTLQYTYILSCTLSNSSSAFALAAVTIRMPCQHNSPNIASVTTYMLLCGPRSSRNRNILHPQM